MYCEICGQEGDTRRVRLTVGESIILLDGDLCDQCRNHVVSKIRVAAMQAVADIQRAVTVELEPEAKPEAKPEALPA